MGGWRTNKTETVQSFRKKKMTASTPFFKQNAKRNNDINNNVSTMTGQQKRKKKLRVCILISFIETCLKRFDGLHSNQLSLGNII